MKYEKRKFFSYSYIINFLEIRILCYRTFLIALICVYLRRWFKNFASLSAQFKYVSFGFSLLRHFLIQGNIRFITSHIHVSKIYSETEGI